jgi:hypothetical protein
MYGIEDDEIMCGNAKRPQIVIYLFNFMERFRNWINPAVRILSLMRYWLNFILKYLMI